MFYSVKDLVHRTKIQATKWEEIFTKHMSNKGLVLKIHKA